MSDYSDIIERLGKATGRNRDIDVAIATTTTPKSAGSWIDQDHPWCNDHPEDEEAAEYTASIDAAIALVERMLPGTELEMTNLYGMARVTLHNEQGPFYGSDECNRLQTALLIALFRALEAKEGRS
jgi:hypothetical protein